MTGLEQIKIHKIYWSNVNDPRFKTEELTHLVVFVLIPVWRKLRVRTTVCVDVSYVVDAVHQVPVTGIVIIVVV